MALYGWWFESKCAANTDISTKSLTHESLDIPGISKGNLEELLSREVSKNKSKFLCSNENKKEDIEKRQKTLKCAIYDVTIELEKMLLLVERALTICSKNYNGEKEYSNVISELQNIDSKILSSQVTELTSLLFPTSNQLEKCLQEHQFVKKNNQFAKYEENIHISKVIYGYLKNSIAQWIAKLS